MSLLKRIERTPLDGESRAYQQRLLGQLLTAIQADNDLRPQVEALLQEKVAEADELHRERVKAKVDEQSLGYFSSLTRPTPTRQQLARAKTPVRPSLNPELRQRLTTAVLQELDPALDTTDTAEVQRQISELVHHYLGILQGDQMLLSKSERTRIIDEVIAEIVGLGPLEALLRDETITEIMVFSPRHVCVRRGRGPFEAANITFDDSDHIGRIIDRIVAPLGKRCDEGRPILQTHLPDGSTVVVTVPTVSANGSPTLHIHRPQYANYTLADLIGSEALTQPAADLLQQVIRAGGSVLVSGPQQADLRELQNVLAAMLPQDAFIICVGQVTELMLPQPNTLTLQTRRPNIDGYGEITLAQVTEHALAMGPDWLIVEAFTGGEAHLMLTQTIRPWLGRISIETAQVALPTLTALAHAYDKANPALLRGPLMRGLPSLLVHTTHTTDTAAIVDAIYAPLREDDLTLAPLFTRETPNAPLRPVAPPPASARLWTHLAETDAEAVRALLTAT